MGGRRWMMYFGFFWKPLTFFWASMHFDSIFFCFEKTWPLLFLFRKTSGFLIHKTYQLWYEMVQRIVSSTPNNAPRNHFPGKFFWTFLWVSIRWGEVPVFWKARYHNNYSRTKILPRNHRVKNHDPEWGNCIFSGRFRAFFSIGLIHDDTSTISKGAKGIPHKIDSKFVFYMWGCG